MKALFAWALAAAFAWPASAGCEGDCRRAVVDVATAWSGDAKAPTRLIMASPSHGYGGPVWAAIEINVEEGWYVYATAAEGGAAPTLEWDGSLNLAPPALVWPPPETAAPQGSPLKVYRGHVILPVSIAPLQPDRDVEVGLRFTYAVCGEVCRPGFAVHRIRVHAAPVHVPAICERFALLIAQALQRARQ